MVHHGTTKVARMLLEHEASIRIICEMMSQLSPRAKAVAEQMDDLMEVLVGLAVGKRGRLQLAIKRRKEARKSQRPVETAVSRMEPIIRSLCDSLVEMSQDRRLNPDRRDKALGLAIGIDRCLDILVDELQVPTQA